jgi:hypothetical protein
MIALRSVSKVKSIERMTEYKNCKRDGYSRDNTCYGIKISKHIALIYIFQYKIHGQVKYNKVSDYVHLKLF